MSLLQHAATCRAWSESLIEERSQELDNIRAERQEA